MNEGILTYLNPAQGYGFINRNISFSLTDFTGDLNRASEGMRVHFDLVKNRAVNVKPVSAVQIPDDEDF
jgi:hypothetical protein